jgi:hypothetical protein
LASRLPVEDKMSVRIDVEGVAGEVRKLRDGLAQLGEAVQKSLWRTEANAVRSAEGAWSVARRDAGRALEVVEDNPAASASVLVGLAALAGLYFLVRNVLESRAVARRPVPRRRPRGAAAVAAAHGPKHAVKRSPRRARPRKSKA